MDYRTGENFCDRFRCYLKTFFLWELVETSDQLKWHIPKISPGSQKDIRSGINISGKWILKVSNADLDNFVL